MPRALFTLSCLIGLALCRPLAAAPADSLLQRDILGLMDKLGMGYSRAELEDDMATSVHRALQGADTATQRIAQPIVEETVHTAFGQRLEQVKALQGAMADCVAARFTRPEIQELSLLVVAEPYQRLIQTLQLSSPQVGEAEKTLMEMLNRDVQAMIRMRLAIASGKAGGAPRPVPPPTGQGTTAPGTTTH